MKVKIKNLDAKDVGEIDLADDIFGVKPRADLLARVVNWQLAKRRSGNHKTKGISDISGTTKKPFAQKGGGRARQGSLRSPQFRGGARIFGPVVRSHEFDLPKKVRKLGLKAALSAKQAEGKLVIVEDGKIPGSKTSALANSLRKFGWSSVLIVDGRDLSIDLVRAAANIPHVDVLPSQGANVYDILRRDTLVLTKDAVKHLEERLQ